MLPMYPAPQRLARQANKLGMVPSVNPAFLRMPDGRVLGDPVVAPGTAPPPTSVTDPKDESESVAPLPGDTGGEPTAASHGADDKASQSAADNDAAIRRV